MKLGTLFTTLIVMAGLGAAAESFAADADRQAEVAQRGAEVMPFSLKATTHIFTNGSFPASCRLDVLNSGCF